MTIETLDDLHVAMSDALNEDAPPAKTDVQYQRRTRFFNRGRDDISKRWFLKALLKMGTVNVQNGVPSYVMPEDFQKPNGLYLFANASGSIVYTNPLQNRDSVLSITRNFTTGRYELTFSPTPTAADVGRFWYFATPPKLENPTDPVLVDGEAALFYGLRQHFLTNRQWVPMQEARDEYENHIDEMLKLNEIPPPGALLDMRSVQSFSPHGLNHRQFYAGNTRRNLG